MASISAPSDRRTSGSNSAEFDIDSRGGNEARTQKENCAKCDCKVRRARRCEQQGFSHGMHRRGAERRGGVVHSKPASSQQNGCRCCTGDNDSPRRVVGENAGSYSCTDIFFAYSSRCSSSPTSSPSAMPHVERWRLAMPAPASLTLTASVAQGLAFLPMPHAAPSHTMALLVIPLLYLLPYPPYAVHTVYIPY